MHTTAYFKNRASVLIALFAALTLCACGDDDGSSSVQSILPDGYQSVSAGRFSPDNARIAMVATPPGDDVEDHLITTNLDGGDVEVLATEGLSYLSTIAWMPDGESVLYGGSDGIMQVELDGSEPTVLVDTFAVAGLDISSDGTRVAWSTNGGRNVLSTTLSSDPDAENQTVTGPVGSMPRFNPDGSRIAYVTDEGFGLSDPDGSNEATIEASVDYLSNVAWRNADTLGGLTDFGVETFDVDSGESNQVQEQFASTNLDISPDGAMFVYGVNGRQNIFLGRF